MSSYLQDRGQLVETYGTGISFQYPQLPQSESALSCFILLHISLKTAALSCCTINIHMLRMRMQEVCKQTEAPDRRALDNTTCRYCYQTLWPLQT